MGHVRDLKKEYMKRQDELMASWDAYAAQEALRAEREAAFKKGFEEGYEIGFNEVVTEITINLITKYGYSDTEVAHLLGIPLETVQKIRQTLKN